MRLPRPFYRLPVKFDIERLHTEVAAMPAGAWAKHPNEIDGNSSVRLISVGGGENDDVSGPMLPTPQLESAPYIRQVLESFGVVWSRSRLMRLSPGASVPQHADINYHWFSRVRVHIPVFTRSEVSFHCGDQQVHMAAGEAWLFDNWRLHRVENPTTDERIHLVADTSGTAAFWRFALQTGLPEAAWRQHRYDPTRDARPLTESAPAPAVMPAAEVQLLLGDLRMELAALDDSETSRTQLAQYHGLLEGFCHDWRQLCALHDDEPAGWHAYERARESLRSASRQLGEGLVMRTNAVAAHRVLEARLLRHLLNAPPPTARPRHAPPTRAHRAVESQPVFIIAAPRSGSTLLFETLAASRQIATVGGEAHWLTESIPALRVGAPGVASNRLVASHCDDAIRAQMIEKIAAQLVDSDGNPVARDSGLFFLEKTPKNALRVPFFDRAFPDARYVFLWRDPRENLGSLIDAWESGRWKTYNGLPGFDGPWSLLLPPGWAWLNGRPVAEIAAWQWECANRMALDDLESLAPGRFITVNYADLVADPAGTIARVFAFIGLAPDAGIQARVAAPLPQARHTLAAADPQKWRRHEAAITPLLPRIQATWDRLRALASSR